MKLLFVFFVFVVPLYAQGNTQKNTLVEKQKAYDRAKIYADKSWNYVNKTPDSTIFFARKALVISSKWGFERLRVYALSDIGLAYTSLQKFDSAEIYLRSNLMLRIKLGDSNDVVSAYNNLGRLFQRKGTYDSAIQHYSMGLELAESANLLNLSSTLLNGLGNCQLNFGNYFMAEELLLRALAIEESLKEPKHLAERYQSLGNLYMKSERYSQAGEYYSTAFGIYKSDGNNEGIIGALLNEGAVLQAKKEYQKALEKYRLALRLAHKYNVMTDLLSIMNNISTSYMKIDSLEQAIHVYEDALNLSIENDQRREYIELTINFIGFLISQSHFDKALNLLPALKMAISESGLKYHMIQYHWLRAQVLAGLGMYEDAHTQLNFYIQLSDSFHKTIDQAQASLAQMEQDKRDKIILEKENALQASELEKQKAKSRNLWLGMAALLLLLVGTVVVTALRLRNARLRNNSLAEKKKSEERLQDLLRQADIQLLETQLKTNRETSHRIGQDLHDNLGSKLAVVQMSIDGIHGKLGIVDHDLSDRFGKVEQLLEESCQDLRTIAHDLQDQQLKYRGLVTELDQYLGIIRDAQGLKVQFVPDGFPEQISESAQKELIAIVRTLIENILRHAQAKQIDIHLTLSESNFIIKIQDDGVGFDTNITYEGKGLLNARNRSEKLGGRLELVSVPGNGTNATIILPINHL